MRILMSSYYFAPSIGGIETACLTLAHGLLDRGHDVTVVTATARAPGASDDFPFRVVRQPSLAAQVELADEHDLLWQNGVCLGLAGLLVSDMPRIFVHHGPLRWAAIKRLVCRTGLNVYVSNMMKDLIGLPGAVIPNSYDERTFDLLPDVERDRDVVFVGRFVPEKGADILIDSLGRLAQKGRRLRATVVGLGAEAANLKSQAAAAGIQDLVEFPGLIRGNALAQLLNRHRVMVVPSRWEEPFGIVALEGLACGCVVVGSQSGGLVEAIGPAGPIVPKEDPDALASVLDRLTTDSELYSRYQANAGAQLQKFTQKRLLDASEMMIAKAVAGHHGANAEPHIESLQLLRW
jgi:glycogen(starch) synthase